MAPKLRDGTVLASAMALTAPAPSPSRTAVGRELVAFRVAVAGIALYLLDDAFGHPELGTEPADHVVSGLVPFAMLGLLALGYPRLRAGARAVACLAVGALAAVAAVADGVRHIAVASLGGDDLAALLAGACGVALMVLGVAVLRASRRREGLRLRHVGWGVAVFAFAWLVLVPVGIAIVATHKARSPVAAASLGAPYERVTLTTSDGLRLAGWYVQSRNGAAVIAFPGRTGPVPHARILVQHGYGVLLLDRRGEGESEGDFNAFGWGGDADVAAAVTYLRSRSDVDPERIGGLGLSVGGELLLAAAAHEDGLRAVVSDGAGVRSLAEHLQMPGIGAMQRWVTPWIAETGAIAVLSGSAPPADLTELAARIAPRPVLLIQALHGTGGEELNTVYAEANAGHTGALHAAPAEYERRVVGFLDRALLGDLRSSPRGVSR
jgi:hypothetical protein